MKYELANYEIFPKMVKNGAETTITIRALSNHVYFYDDYDYRVEIIPMEETREATNYDYDILAAQATQDTITFKYTFTGEQEYIIRLFDAPQAKRQVKNFHIYCLNEDLYCLRPYKGDTHVHSRHSDGNDSPEFVVSNYRKGGFDFMCLTDHHKYYPSELAIQACKDLPVDISIFHGEEVHSIDNHVHIVNFGGSASVNEMFQKDEATYRKEVEEIRKEKNLPQNADGFEIAASLWVFDKIRSVGGLAIFAHPHWIAEAYHIKSSMVDYFFDNRSFDAVELLGGHEVYSNNMQLEYYNEQRAKGNTVPIVGASDSHEQEGPDAEWFKMMSSIVLAPNKELKSLQDAIMDYKSVAVEHYNGEYFRVHGPYRLVKYGIFLMHEYFPVHDELCHDEGQLMKQYFCGDETAKQALACLQGRTERYLENCFRK